MIITVTMNPSIDRTASLTAPLQRGGVNRIATITGCAGGKGINVAAVIHGAGEDTLAVVPAPERDPFVEMCADQGLPIQVVATSSPVRSNLTLTEPDGTTTKINAPGTDPGKEALAEVTATLKNRVRPGDWVALSGSLPAGVPTDFYVGLVSQLRAAGANVAVDTSDAPLTTLAAHFSSAPPTLIKPNAEELGQLAGIDGAELERGAEAGELGPVVAAAEAVIRAGVETVLVTLGGAGAVLVSHNADHGEVPDTSANEATQPRIHAWQAAAHPTEVRSTVGAGDSALAGYLLAASLGLSMSERLAWAVAYGSAAAALPGTELPQAIDMADYPISVTSIG